MIPLNLKPTHYGFRLDPLPSKEQLNRLYQRNEFYVSLKPDYFAEREADQLWWNQTYAFTLSALDVPIGSFERALDFGCGPGYFAHFLKEFEGVNYVFGYDPASTARLFASEHFDLTIFSSEEECLRQAPFDLIICWEVLEHVPNPEATLILLREMLSSNGYLLIVVPNDFNPLQSRLMHLYGKYLVDKTHLHYFSHQGLRRLVESCDLKVISQEGTFPMEIFALLGIPYISRRHLGKHCHRLRKQFESWTNDEERRRLYQLFVELGWGRESVLIARRRKASEMTAGFVDDQGKAQALGGFNQNQSRVQASIGKCQS